MAFPLTTRVTDELIDAAIWNADVVANLNAAPHPVPKTADESVVSSTTPQDDDHLFFAMAANEIYYVRGLLWHQSASVGNFKHSFAAPAGAAFMLISRGIDSGGTNWTQTNIRSSADSVSLFSGSTGNIGTTEGIVVNGGTAGNARLTWAQAASNGTATILKKGSCLLISRLA